LHTKLDYQVYCKEIEYEDLRSYTRRLFEHNDDLSVNLEVSND